MIGQKSLTWHSRSSGEVGRVPPFGSFQDTCILFPRNSDLLTWTNIINAAMKKTFSARRVPRKIGADNEEPPAGSSSGAVDTSGMSLLLARFAALSLTCRDRATRPLTRAEPTIKRPAVKPRKSSSLRTSFGPSAVDDDSEDSSVVTPKRSNLSRVAIQRNAEKRSSLLAPSLPLRREEDDDERPSYSKDYLQELKDSTPTTPRDLTSNSASDVEDVSTGTQALDLSSKFGSSLARYQQSSAIPTDAEIAEKKARRARLAKEQEFISLDPSDAEEDEDENVMEDEKGRLILKPKDKYDNLESRLVRDDEDIMEGFEEFTGDAGNRIMVGRKAEREAEKQRKVDMAAAIAQAEGAEDEESDDSERERNEAFEHAQTRHGTYSANTTEDANADTRPKTPPKISPLPQLDSVLERLRKQVVELQTGRMQKMQEMDALKKEKVRLGEEEVRVQQALKETGERYEKLRSDMGITKEGTPALEGERSVVRSNGDQEGTTELGSTGGLRSSTQPGSRTGFMGRGLESLGSTPVGMSPAFRGGEDSDSG